MLKPLAVALAFAFRGLAVTTPDETAFVQRSVVKHSDGETPEEAKDAGFLFSVGQRVELEGYGPDRNSTIIGRAHGGRYSLNMEGYGNMLNIEEKYLKRWNTPYPETTDPTAGPVAHVLGFDYKSKPWIVNKGQTPHTWNVYIPGIGLVPNVPDGDIVREKWWYKQGNVAQRGAVGNAAVLVGKLPERIPSGQVIELTEAPVFDPQEAKASHKRKANDVVALKKANKGGVKKRAEKLALARKTKAMTAAKRERSTVTVKADSFGSLGITTKLWKGSEGEEILQVEAIAFGGPIERWNLLHPAEKVRVGDRILSINGHGGNARTLLKVMSAITLNHVGHAMTAQSLPATTVVVDRLKRSTRSTRSRRSTRSTRSKFVSDADTVLDEALKIATKGPSAYLREALPYNMGKVLINGKEKVEKCGDITSQLLCQQSAEKFELACAGWGGAACLAKEEAVCANFATPAACHASQQRFGVECAGWGGSSCLSKGASASLITVASICNSAAVRLNSVEVAGWGGEKCLGTHAKCEEITVPGKCNDARAQLSMQCLGWGGSSCLAPGAAAELITTKPLCLRAKERFGIEAAGWGGSHCLAKEGLTCNKVTDESECQHAKERLGIECAGWGGSSCLPKGASSLLITSSGICARSESALGIPSGGWSGTSCVPAGTMTCSSITRPGVCNDAAARLSLDCAGWSGNKCFASGEPKCTEVTGQSICKTSMAKFGINCVWNGDSCFPDGGSNSSMQQKA